MTYFHVLKKKIQQIVDDQVVPPPQFICKQAIEDNSNKGSTFRWPFYRTLKIISFIGLGIAGLAVIKSRFR